METVSMQETVLARAPRRTKRAKSALGGDSSFLPNASPNLLIPCATFCSTAAAPCPPHAPASLARPSPAIFGELSNPIGIKALLCSPSHHSTRCLHFPPMSLIPVSNSSGQSHKSAKFILNRLSAWEKSYPICG